MPEDGQRWTTLEELRAGHRNELRDEDGLVGIGVEPKLAIGQRALLVEDGGFRLLWDCVALLDAAEAVRARGGIDGVAISHPHYYTTMVEWAHAFDCPVYLHEADREWVMRPDPRVVFWDGETQRLGDSLTLVRCGGHFAGGTVLHHPRANALLSGDIVQVIPDRRHVGFMYSYPNLIPLGEEAIHRIVAALEPFEFERIFGAWWGTVVRRDGKAAVLRSAERYVRAIRGEQLD